MESSCHGVTPSTVLRKTTPPKEFKIMRGWRPKKVWRGNIEAIKLKTLKLGLKLSDGGKKEVLGIAPGWRDSSRDCISQSDTTYQHSFASIV